MSGLVEMAFTAELSRSAPQIVTQVRRPDKGQDLSAGALFFDSESRAMQADQETDESQNQARLLEMQAQMMRVINSMQTRTGGGPAATLGGHGAGAGPPDVPPKLFVLPKVPGSSTLAGAAPPRGAELTRCITRIAGPGALHECARHPAAPRRPRGPHPPRHRPILGGARRPRVAPLRRPLLEQLVGIVRAPRPVHPNSRSPDVARPTLDVAGCSS